MLKFISIRSKNVPGIGLFACAHTPFCRFALHCLIESTKKGL